LPPVTQTLPDIDETSIPQVKYQEAWTKIAISDSKKKQKVYVSTNPRVLSGLRFCFSG
jgi:hypothetical protein